MKVTRAGLAVLCYKETHGVYPERLEQLDVKGLADPFTGGGLIYRAEGGGFVIYSVGPDQKDDAGNQPIRQGQQTDDIVWRYQGK